MTIHQAIIAVSNEIKAIDKTQRNTHFKFQFRGIDDVYNHVQPLLAKHGIFCTSEVVDAHSENVSVKNGNSFRTTVTVKYTFFAKDGSSVSSTVIGEAIDQGDKSFGKAFSYAHKVCLLQMFTIPTDQADDPDKEGWQLAGKQPAQRAKREAPKQLNATQEQEHFVRDINEHKKLVAKHLKALGVELSQPENKELAQVLFKTALQKQVKLDQLEGWLTEEIVGH